MTLVLKSLDDDGAERRIDAGATLSIGRGTDNDLVLVDPSREVSKTHCRIETSDGKFVLTDLSINGVTIEGSGEALGPGTRHTLASGDIFVIGSHRFAVDIVPDGGGGDHTSASMPAMPSADPTAPRTVSHILDGASEGVEQRASGGVTGEADRWLSTLPQGSADATMRLPMGWDEPPRTHPETDDAPLLPSDFDQPASEFANRSEHLAASNSVLQVPRAQQMIPTNWLDDDGDLAPDAPAAGVAETPPSRVPQSRTPLQAARAAGAAPPPSSGEARRALAEGGRLDSTGLAALSEADLMRRCGAALRAVLEAFDALEAAQAVAEHDCGLQVAVADGALWADFFASNRDPLLSLLVEAHPTPAEAIAQRAVALADRQRALGRAVADAAHELDAKLGPEAIESETKSRFRRGPLASIAAWERYVGLHAEIGGETAKNGVPSFLALLRNCFSRVHQKRP